ncbi:juvenile hormone esterase-like [Pectinophora gossypiella]|uniref:juvenile hormone esterase-like n=1 Tax=Pectinophora gossypiella TaxID=13191 RepID=UPI00214E0EF2|nr:juvenile hormone esterase-like [Pectinophora gossypiella]XP_049867837.1 juvenile hormone esterase-like [Pectinophora gossypiella]XP_049867838.1 juvenile hormone esterase-like [Pectinophora gossypiella]
MSVVETAQGQLKGVVCEKNGAKYIAFKGIPYAKPPVGNLRFKAPEPPDPWEGVRDATEHGPVCPQYNERMERIDPGNEDCLYLNVFTRAVSPPRPLPVMVWIHGGAFYTGSGNSDFYGPEFFMAHDVILVTFNYRLEILGFLCLDNEEVPGNAGLKDQAAALKWVKRNISAFGGDSNNITIFGCSAGAASTSYHLVSKMSEGLFHKAICQSGVCLNEWAYNFYGKQRAFQLGKHLGKDTNDPAELLEFLRSVPALSLVNIQLPPLELKYLDIADSIIFGPVIEKSDLKVEKFLTEPPQDIVKRGQIANVPVILGYTSGEGIEIARKLSGILGFMSMVGAVVPREIKLKMTPEKLKAVDELIRQRYFNGEEVTMKLIQKVSNLESDKLFMYNIRRFARYHVKHTSSPAYLYKFTAETERNYLKKYYKLDSLEGVCHADELPYLFNVTNIEIPLTDESRGIVQTFVQLWTNFASTGRPTTDGQWKPFTETEQNYYVIGKTQTCVLNENQENMKFWDDIYEEIECVCTTDCSST